jgi:hypothetical protein
MIVTGPARELHITKALEEQKQRPGGGEFTNLFFRGKRELFPVIELPLSVPVLNARSFRIAPLLEDHPKRDLIEQDPESDEAQGVVAELVRTAHRYKEGLKESLHVDGQDQPGVITRSGKLINGNSRCVLLRELVHDGTIHASSVIRVAVLPADTDNSEELGLESTLQQQKDFKDDYNLVSRLMMLQRLSESGMSDQAIAAQQRTKGGPKRVKELREVLVLMGRARLLPTEHLPLSAFVKDEDQQENWLGLRLKVQEIEGFKGRDAADAFIREWLIAYFTGHDSVHQLRNATEGWTKRDLLPHLAEAGSEGELLHDMVTTSTATNRSLRPPLRRRSCSISPLSRPRIRHASSRCTTEQSAPGKSYRRSFIRPRPRGLAMQLSARRMPTDLHALSPRRMRRRSPFVLWLRRSRTSSTTASSRTKRMTSAPRSTSSSRGSTKPSNLSARSRRVVRAREPTRDRRHPRAARPGAAACRHPRRQH